ncbi:MAG TPA: prolyl oligopeptidase family serine peptidase [Thermoanaerobaculia bacterium]|nr:prolyl oligopeptidase family serine peptidase [Thermoanaerobaculia bacterium]
MTRARLLLAGAALAAVATAQPAPAPTPRPELDLERVMSHPEWIGRGPTRAVWAGDSASVFWERPAPTRDGLDVREDETWESDLDGRIRRQIGPGDASVVPSPFGAAHDRDRGRRLEIRQGNLFLVDVASGAARQLTRTAQSVRRPFFLDDDRVGFERDGQVYARDLQTGLEEQLFEVRFEEDPFEARGKERREADFLRRQQEHYFEWIRAEDARAQRRLERQLEERREDPARTAPPFYLGEKRAPQALSASPDGQWMLVAATPKRANGGKRDQMPKYVTASGWVETAPVRPKVGTDDGSGETLLLLDRRRHQIVEVDLSALPTVTDDPLAELREAAAARRKAELAAAAQESKETRDEANASEEAERENLEDEKAEGEDTAAANDEGKEKTEAAPKVRPLRFDRPLWTRDRRSAILQAVSVDNKDRWIFALDLESREVRPLHHRHDPAWINWSFRDLAWLPGEETLYLLSEASGWSQLYLLDPRGEPGKNLRRLTTGDFVVHSPTPSPDGALLYFTGNPEHPGRTDVYRVPAAGGPMEQVTDLGGRSSFELSPDGARLLLTHSTATRPPELWVQDARPGAEPRPLTDTVSAEFAAIGWTEPQVVAVPSTHHQRPIWSRVYLPDADAPGLRDGRRPAVVFVHGAGYLQNAHLGWSSYFREFMFHTLLARQGYVVLDMDYRGSAGYGRDWRTAIYRNMGWPEVEDLADGVRYLAAEHGVDPARVGVYGGSYGGFLTLMSLFNRPKLFAAGAALRPVTDWAHYNHPYTANILNTPDVDPEAYERSSPIEFASGLAKPLVIATGMLDDNVLFQDSVRLVQRLIELEKSDWWIAIYPVEPHGFREPSSWLDEYRRIHDLFDRYLE